MEKNVFVSDKEPKKCCEDCGGVYGKTPFNKVVLANGGCDICETVITSWEGVSCFGGINWEKATPENYINKKTNIDFSELGETGVKYDSGKLRWGLLPIKPVKEVIKVLMFGSKKYSDDNWKKIPKIRERYYDAAIRHITDWKDGEVNDKESGFSHLAHAICCLLFMLWEELKNKKDEL